MSRRGREEEREREWRRLRRVRRFAWITLLSKGSPSLSLSPLRSEYRDTSRINFSIRFLDERRRRSEKRSLFKFKNGRKLPGISLHV